MQILNIMLGKGKGGIEQAAYDYHEALLLAGIAVQSVLHPRAQMHEIFTQAGYDTAQLSARANWDLLAARTLRRRITQMRPSAIICHGNRALSLALRAGRMRAPIIGVAHNYKIQKRMPKCDAVLCITRDLLEECVHLDIARDKLFHLPNMTRLPAHTPPREAFNSPVRIGTMGRFVEKKGIDIFLQSLKALAEYNIAFEAYIGGGGPLEAALQRQAETLGLANHVHFTGWVADKQAFFESLDLFVLPSHHEPFGIVLIEAMAAGLPVITTDTEGPCEIITQNHDAVMIEKARPYAMAGALRELIEDAPRALAIGRAARQTVCEQYDLPVFSQRLAQILQHAASTPT